MPLSQQIHQDKALANISVSYRPGEMIADKLVPAVPVKHDTDKYYVFDFGEMRLEETLAAKQAESHRIDYDMSTSTYSLQNHRIKQLVLQEDKDNSDKAVRLDVDATESLTRKILIRREVECATVMQTGANWSNKESLTSTVAWSQNTTLSNPIIKIDSGTSKIILSSGFTPNCLALDDGAFRAAKEHVSVVDRVKHTSAKSVTEEMLASLFNVKKVLVGRGIYDSAQQGLDNVPAAIWTNSAFLAYMETSPGLRKASAAYTFVQNNKGNPFRVDRWREEDPEGNWIRVQSKFQFKPVATQAAYLFIDVT